MYKNLIELSKQLNVQTKVCYVKNHQIIIAKGNVCLFDELGPKINILWHPKKGNIIISTSTAKQTAYMKIQQFQFICNVEFRHAHICPYLKSQIKKSEKFYKPCACVMIKNEGNILLTRRKLTLNSFPGAWVLPGGHLQKGQGLLEGGIRQAQQQVALLPNLASIQLNQGIMAWESAFCKDDQILSSAFVIFFTVKTATFEVKAQQAQVEQFLWKQISDNKDQFKYDSTKKDGYGQAHLNYLSFYRKINLKIQEQKVWIKQQIA